MQDMNLEDRVMGIFFDVFPNLKKSDFDWNKQQKEYENWDSFAHLHLITLVEEKFNILFSIDESISINSAAKLLEYVRVHE